METLTIVLATLVAVAAASAVARLVPRLPAPVVQIAVGFLVGATTSLHVELEPELFFVLFLPPLLFLDGWRLPKDEMGSDVRWVLGLVTVLVVCTVLGVGSLLHWMIPGMPLAVAFALAAVLSPTDPVAVSAIASRVAVPRRMMHILEGEALLNDASGLVCLRFAVAAATTGVFSLPVALGTFLWVAVAGLAIGGAVVLATLKTGDLLTSRTGADPGWQVLVSLLMPFAAYLLAERFEASGILAAVGAGLAMTFGSRFASIGAATRVQGASVWSFVQLALNGSIFVLLGEQLPGILRGADEAALTAGGWPRLALATCATFLALFALRWLWTWIAFRLSSARGRSSALMARAGPRLVAAFSLAGVRGAVTLAGVLTLPLMMPDGSPFPDRDVAIFVAATVILLSLAAASVGLPLALAGIELPLDIEGGREEERLRRAIMDAAVAAVVTAGELHVDDSLYRREAVQFASKLGRKSDGDAGQVKDVRRRRTIERELHLVSLDAARKEAARLVAAGEARSSHAARIVRELDLSELRLSE